MWRNSINVCHLQLLICTIRLPPKQVEPFVLVRSKLATVWLTTHVLIQLVLQALNLVAEIELKMTPGKPNYDISFLFESEEALKWYCFRFLPIVHPSTLYISFKYAFTETLHLLTETAAIEEQTWRQKTRSISYDHSFCHFFGNFLNRFSEGGTHFSESWYHFGKHFFVAELLNSFSMQ